MTAALVGKQLAARRREQLSRAAATQISIASRLATVACVKNEKEPTSKTERGVIAHLKAALEEAQTRVRLAEARVDMHEAMDKQHDQLKSEGEVLRAMEIPAGKLEDQYTYRRFS